MCLHTGSPGHGIRIFTFHFNSLCDRIASPADSNEIILCTGYIINDLSSIERGSDRSPVGKRIARRVRQNISADLVKFTVFLRNTVIFCHCKHGHTRCLRHGNIIILPASRNLLSALISLLQCLVDCLKPAVCIVISVCSNGNPVGKRCFLKSIGYSFLLLDLCIFLFCRLVTALILFKLLFQPIVAALCRQLKSRHITFIHIPCVWRHRQHHTVIRTVCLVRSRIALPVRKFLCIAGTDARLHFKINSYDIVKSENTDILLISCDHPG